MLKVIVSLFLVTSISYAGIWGFMGDIASTAIGTSLANAGKGSKVYYEEDTYSSSERKIQKALYGLGFYDGSYDGNLNKMPIRMAIKEFQRFCKKKPTGILNDVEKQNLIYIYELQYSVQQLQKNKNYDRAQRDRIYDEIDITLAAFMKEDE